MQNRIDVRDLSVHFKEVKALQDFTVTFEENRIYGLLGRNGAGKTTLLNAINNRLFPTSGGITIDGMPAMENDRAQAAVFFVGDQMLGVEDLRVDKYFGLTKNFYPGFDMDYAMGLAKAFGLNTKKRMRSLSTGYATIAKLIAALSTDARYLLLDEPVLGLDANHRDQFYRELLDNFGRNPRAIIISTHLIEEVSGIIEQVVIIKDGRLLMNQPAEEVRRMGYSVSGMAADVDAYCAGRELLSSETLGGLKTACLMGAPERVPETLTVSALDMQQLFIHLTNSEGGRS